MKYSIYIRGRAWSFQLASSLNKINKLKFLVTSYPKFYIKKYNVPRKLIKSVFFLEILIRVLKKINPYLSKIKITLDPHIIVSWITDYIYSTFYLSDADVYILGFGNISSKIIKKAKKKGIKTIYFLNTNSPKECERIFRSEYKKFGLLDRCNMENKLITNKTNENIKDADYVGCISSFQKNNYIKEGLISEDKIFSTIMSVDTSVFYPKKIHNKKFRVIGVGNDFITKGFKYLIEAFNNLKLPNSELLLVGDLDKKIISKIIKLEENNRIIGTVNEFDLPKYYNQSSIFCLPTLTEGAPAVISQALACGLPIIVTKNCHGPEVINGGCNGFVIEEMNSKCIEEKIKFFYDNPKEITEMGIAAAAYAREKLSFDVMAQDINKFFENIKK